VTLGRSILTTYFIKNNYNYNISDNSMNRIHVLVPKFLNQDEYLKFKNSANDSNKLNDTLLEYELTVINFIITMKNDDTVIHRDYISISDMLKWLSGNKYKNINKNRALYYAHIARIQYCKKTNSDQ
jgi:hypothetical protein